MQVFKRLLLLLGLLILPNFTFAEIVHYKNNYSGIEPGKSTLSDVKKILGEPKEVKVNNYRFDKVVINLGNNGKAKVNSITIDNDPTYQCPNGLKLGDSIEKLMQILPESKKSKDYYSDSKYGVIYWLEVNKIKRIVLAASLSVKDPNRLTWNKFHAQIKEFLEPLRGKNDPWGDLHDKIMAAAKNDKTSREESAALIMASHFWFFCTEELTSLHHSVLWGNLIAPQNAAKGKGLFQLNAKMKSAVLEYPLGFLKLNSEAQVRQEVLDLINQTKDYCQKIKDINTKIESYVNSCGDIQP